MSWGISENATDKEKVKAELNDFLQGMNSCGEINYAAYSSIYDEGMRLLDKMHELGRPESS